MSDTPTPPLTTPPPPASPAFGAAHWDDTHAVMWVWDAEVRRWRLDATLTASERVKRNITGATPVEDLLRSGSSEGPKTTTPASPPYTNLVDLLLAPTTTAAPTTTSTTAAPTTTTSTTAAPTTTESPDTPREGDYRTQGGARWQYIGGQWRALNDGARQYDEMQLRGGRDPVGGPVPTTGAPMSTSTTAAPAGRTSTRGLSIDWSSAWDTARAREAAPAEQAPAVAGPTSFSFHVYLERADEADPVDVPNAMRFLDTSVKASAPTATQLYDPPGDLAGVAEPEMRRRQAVYNALLYLIASALPDEVRDETTAVAVDTRPFLTSLADKNSPLWDTLQVDDDGNVTGIADLMGQDFSRDELVNDVSTLAQSLFTEAMTVEGAVEQALWAQGYNSASGGSQMTAEELAQAKAVVLKNIELGRVYARPTYVNGNNVQQDVTVTLPGEEPMTTQVPMSTVGMPEGEKMFDPYAWKADITQPTAMPQRLTAQQLQTIFATSSDPFTVIGNLLMAGVEEGDVLGMADAAGSTQRGAEIMPRLPLGGLPGGEAIDTMMAGARGPQRYGLTYTQAVQAPLIIGRGPDGPKRITELQTALVQAGFIDTDYQPGVASDQATMEGWRRLIAASYTERKAPPALLKERQDQMLATQRTEREQFMLSINDDLDRFIQDYALQRIGIPLKQDQVRKVESFILGLGNYSSGDQQYYSEEQVLADRERQMNEYMDEQVLAVPGSQLGLVDGPGQAEYWLSRMYGEDNLEQFYAPVPGREG